MSNHNRFIKADAADIDRDAVAAAPVGGTGKARLIDPFHDHAAVYFAAEVDIRRFGEEAKG